MKVTLISPKGPLYRSSGGIFRKSLRYQPLTLTTLAALAPPELDVQFELLDEGTGDVPLDLNADLVGMTVITGSAPRAYELAAQYRRRGIKVVLGGPHVTLLPDEAEQHADAICTGYAEQSWPQLLRDFAAGTLQRRYTQHPQLDLAGMPFPRRELFSKRDYLTQAVFEATRSCAHDCEFCVAPTAWGRKQLQKPVEDVVADIRQFGARRLIFIDLNLISDRAYARALFTALVPLKVKWFGLSTSLIGRDPDLMELMARSGCSGLLIGFETVNAAGLSELGKKFNDPDAVSRAGRGPASPQDQHPGLLRVRQRSRRPDRLRAHRGIRQRRRHRSAALRHPHAVPGHAAASALRKRRPHPHAQLGAVRRTTRGASAAAHVAAPIAGRTRARVEGGVCAARNRAPAREGARRSCPSPLRPISATASTRTICTRITTATGRWSEKTCGREELAR